jgi:hypothetical protein
MTLIFYYMGNRPDGGVPSDVDRIRKVIETHGGVDKLGTVPSWAENLPDAEQEYIIANELMMRTIVGGFMGRYPAKQMEDSMKNFDDVEMEYIEWLHDRPNRWDE